MGYHQIELDESSKKYTAFITEFRLFHFKRVSFGLSVAPRFFQYVMNRILKEFDFVKIFFERFFIFSLTKEEHLEHIRKVLNKLHENNVSISFEKSKFFSKEVNYLGHNIDENGIRPDIARIDKLINFIKSKTIRKIQKILGFINWFREFVPNLSK